MKTKIVDRNEINEVVEVLRSGGVVCFPTDTVYGIGVVYDNLDALNRLKESKGRPENKPIPMMIGSISQLDDVAKTNKQITHLTKTFMPGGFTIVLNKKEHVSDVITNGFKTIALRMPDDEFILEVIQCIGKPLLVTSANLSGMPTGVYFEDVKHDFDGRVDMIVKGECKGSVSSTIVDATDELKILRQGPIEEEKIMQVWREVL
jgi:L-threonylcarbamoyladenylate synthase